MKMKALDSITFSDLIPASHRKSLADIAHYLKRFEDCIDNYDATFPFSLLHYAFIFRRFDAEFDGKRLTLTTQIAQGQHEKMKSRHQIELSPVNILLMKKIKLRRK